jgi:serine/threonine protein kinase/predicted esterase
VNIVTTVECDPHRIQAYLNDTLDAIEEANWFEHLSWCKKCRTSLEFAAGSVDDWNKAKDLLAFSHEVVRSLSDEPSEPQTGVALDLARYVQLNPTDDPQRMGRIGSFEVMGVIGRGGMGIVFKAFDPALHRAVAIKVLDPIVARLESSRRRFARESQAMAAIAHEHIVPVYAVDEHHDLPYIVMEYVPGGTLENRLANGKPMTAIEIVRTVLQIAKGLAAAHRVGVIHRDIKPSNILLDTGTERIRVADFGLAREIDDAKQTHSQTLVGTPLYMSPEQVQGDVCDARSDLFSLGSLMVAMCTGKPPFQADMIYATMQKIIHESPADVCSLRNDLPTWMSAMVGRLLAKSREDRFQSADELCTALEEELAVLQCPDGAKEPPRSWLNTQQTLVAVNRRSSLFAALSPLAMLAVLAVGGWFVTTIIRTQTNRLEDGRSRTFLVPDNDADDPVVAKWVKQLCETQGHNPIAFGLGPNMLSEVPDRAVRITELAWPNLKDRYQKTAILKVFRVADHEQVLRILNLGMMDDDPDVRNYASTYVSEYAFRSFEGEPEIYTRWYSEHKDLPLGEVFEAHYRRLAIELKRLGPVHGIDKWIQRKDDLTDPNQKLEALAQSGLSDLFQQWFEIKSMSEKHRLALLTFFRSVPLEANEAKRLLTTYASASPRDGLSLPAIRALMASDLEYSVPLIAQHLGQWAQTFGRPAHNSQYSEIARVLSETGDDRFIPLLIGLIDADNSYDTIYGVGYFGLGFSKLGKLVQVPYSSFHDGNWWRSWWGRNRDRFSEAAQSTAIPDYPKTAAGKKYKPIDHDIETHSGRIALLKSLIQERQFDRVQDVAELCVQHGDQRAIPYLIGAVEADNSYATVYGVGYFGLRHLVRPLRVEYSPFHDGAWWRRWWERNKSQFDEEVRSIEIPIFSKSVHGQSYAPFPADLDTHDGRVSFVRQELKDDDVDVRKLCELFDLSEDTRDLAIMIGLLEFFAGQPQMKEVQSAMDRQIGFLKSKTFPRSPESWREWWSEHRMDWPDTRHLDIYDFRNKHPFSDRPKPIADQDRTASMSPDIDSVPSQLISMDDSNRMQYFLIGEGIDQIPLEKRKLVVVLPGGDGGKSFEPFVRRIWKFSLDKTWMIAQPIAPRWFPDQAIVWPTTRDVSTDYSGRDVGFSTETFIDRVIEDVCSKAEVPQANRIVLGWSSSGPAVYSHSLTEGSKAMRTYVSMSVFIPERIPKIGRLSSARYVVDHSREDQVCAYRYAQQARSLLEAAGASVKAVDYRGGHGWHDAPFERLRTGLFWLVNEER